MVLETYGSRRGRTIFLALKEKILKQTMYIPINMSMGLTKDLKKRGLTK